MNFTVKSVFYHCVTTTWAPVSLLKLLIRQCSITETLESQVAGMCTIDLFHCGVQQWLCAPQCRAPQEELREHAETQSRCCPTLSRLLSQFVACWRSRVDSFLQMHWQCVFRTHALHISWWDLVCLPSNNLLGLLLYSYFIVGYFCLFLELHYSPPRVGAIS